MTGFLCARRARHGHPPRVWWRMIDRRRCRDRVETQFSTRRMVGSTTCVCTARDQRVRRSTGGPYAGKLWSCCRARQDAAPDDSVELRPLSVGFVQADGTFDDPTRVTPRDRAGDSEYDPATGQRRAPPTAGPKVLEPGGTVTRIRTTTGDLLAGNRPEDVEVGGSPARTQGGHHSAGDADGEDHDQGHHGHAEGGEPLIAERDADRPPEHEAQ